MKKLLSLFLVVVMLCSAFMAVTVSADQHTYGVDNLNNKSGDLIIGYIGGSITEGAQAPSVSERYSTIVVDEYFRKNYPNKNVIELNASIGGTGSAYGHIRMRNDFKLDSGVTPDVVFVEFSVNDATTNASAGTGITQNVESIVRQLLSLPKIPAIVFIYATKAQDGGVRNDGLNVSIPAHRAVAKNYGIYEIDIDEYVWDGVADKKWTWNPETGSSLPYIATDTSHPRDFGNRLYADYIIEKLNADKNKAFKKLDCKTAPAGDYVYGELKEVPLSDSSVKLSDGWKYVANVPADPTQRNSNYPNRFFTNGYYVAEKCVGETIELEFTGRGFGIDLNRTKNSGTIKWEIFDESGKSVKTGSHTNYYKTDTGRCCGSMLATGLEYGKYKLVITGALNQTAVNDYNSNSSQGGTGTYLGIESIVIEKAMPVIAPKASGAGALGNPEAGEKLVADYDYSCKMYSEKGSVIKWYQATSENGSYKEIATGTELALTDAHAGDYVKFSVTPVNEQGTEGETVYSEAVLVTYPAGMISSYGASIKVDGADSDTLKAGKNKITVKVENSDEYDRPVTMVVSLNNAVSGGIKYTVAAKTLTKTVKAGEAEDFEIELDIAAETEFNEGKILVYSTDMLEPAILAEEIAAVEFVGLGENGESVYAINRFE